MISVTEERIKTNKLLMDICNFNKYLFDTSTLSSEEIQYYNKITDGFNKQIQFYIDWLDSDEAKRIFQDSTRYNDQAFKEIDEYTQYIIEDTKLTSDEIIDKIYDAGLTRGYKEIRRTKHYNDATKYGLKFLQNYNFSLIQNVNEDLKKHIRTQIFNGIVAGETMPEVAQKILHAHETSLTGKTLSARQRAMMIARTETARAMTQGRLQSYANYSVQEVKILTAGDSNVCAICREAEAKIYPIEDAANLVPFHPLCRCSVTAYIRHGILPGNPDEDARIMNLTPLSFKDILYSEGSFEFNSMSYEKIPEDLPNLLKLQLLKFDDFIKDLTFEYGYVANLATGNVSKYITDEQSNSVNLSRARAQVSVEDDNLNIMIATHYHLGLNPFNHEDFKAVFEMMNYVSVKFMVVHTPNDIFIAEFKDNALDNCKDIYNASKSDYKNMMGRNMKFQSSEFAAEALWDNYLNNEILNKFISFRRISK